jgi:hypothetical protein
VGVETHAFAVSSPDLEGAARSISDWLESEKGFVPKLKARTDDGYLLRLEKSDFARQLTGLVYTLEISLERQDGTVVVKVDDGDIRNQLLGLGIGAMFIWPLLLTSGYGWLTKGDLRREVIARAAKLLGATW